MLIDTVILHSNGRLYHLRLNKRRLGPTCSILDSGKWRGVSEGMIGLVALNLNSVADGSIVVLVPQSHVRLGCELLQEFIRLS